MQMVVEIDVPRPVETELPHTSAFEAVTTEVTLKTIIEVPVTEASINDDMEVTPPV